MSNQAFEKWALGYSGCDGGDIGSQNSPSVWVCGIEWGGGHDREDLLGELASDMTAPPKGYKDIEENRINIYNRQALKLLSAINGGQVGNFRVFGETVQPFVQGSSGYFKTNIYPMSFKDTNMARWLSDFSEITGFESKSDYIQWCKQNRFPQMRSWVSTFRPKLIICFGKTYKADFISAFADSETNFNIEVIDEREISWGFNQIGTLVVILPFMVNSNGLNKNVTIQEVGERIAELLQGTK